MIRRFRAFARQQLFVLIVGFIAAGFVVGERVALSSIPDVIDGRVLLVLFALLVAVELLRQAGHLERIVVLVVSRFHRARSFVLALVIATGVLSAIVTNDVALFVVIPLTLIARSMAPFRVENAVALEVVAANLLGALTPLGNPQNLYIYHLTGWSPATFIAAMTPFVLVALAGLVIAVLAGEPAAPILFTPPPSNEVDRLRGGFGLLILLLVFAEIAHLIPASIPAVVAIIAVAAFLRSRIGDMGLSIVPLFFFAFVIVEGLRSLDVYTAFDELPIASPELRLYVSVIAASQLISNVPATVLFAPLADGDWRLLLHAANAGGCGTIIASLANLLGWRIWVRENGPSRAFLHRLLVLNAVFLFWISITGWLLASF